MSSIGAVLKPEQVMTEQAAQTIVSSLSGNAGDANEPSAHGLCLTVVLTVTSLAPYTGLFIDIAP